MTDLLTPEMFVKKNAEAGNLVPNALSDKIICGAKCHKRDRQTNRTIYIQSANRDFLDEMLGEDFMKACDKIYIENYGETK